jgi:hypothetical protein
MTHTMASIADNMHCVYLNTVDHLQYILYVVRKLPHQVNQQH